MVRVDLGAALEGLQGGGTVLGARGAHPRNLGALMMDGRADLINRLILNVSPGSLGILLEKRITFRTPSGINTFSSTF